MSMISDELTWIKQATGDKWKRTALIAIKVSLPVIETEDTLFSRKLAIENMMGEPVIRVWFKLAGVPFFDNYIRPYRKILIRALYGRRFAVQPGNLILLSWVGRRYPYDVPVRQSYQRILKPNIERRD